MLWNFLCMSRSCVIENSLYWYILPTLRKHLSLCHTSYPCSLLSLPAMPFPDPQHPFHPRPTALCLSGFLINHDVLEVTFFPVSSTYHVCVCVCVCIKILWTYNTSPTKLYCTSPTKLFLISEYECYIAIASSD